MRHRVKGRKLGRNASHRKAMFRNMACSLIKSVVADEDAENAPKHPGRIVTTVQKAKSLRPFVEKCITLARRAQPHLEKAEEFGTSAERGSSEWKSWRESDQWQEWAAAMAPALSFRRRLISELRDIEAVEVLMSELGPRYIDREGGYTRVVKLATVRLGDSGEQALIEFVGDDRDRQRTTSRSSAAPVVDESEETETTSDEEANESVSSEAEASDETSTDATAEDGGADEEKKDD
ncbi:bL17 family ribosomal protein [Thalassoroseus pseudoceratinae]|uniref:bL17 family ribosomal protein n=1 Tax=Thalassoroseus pseudoceratinae TaxID=2713176 RepID=UPI00141DD72F|nr:L17 family ribosomal protein [Thalassoroseus pseudoceratinae]